MELRYTYEPAATETHPNKPGFNKIGWKDNGSENPEDWTRFSSEYCPTDPREEPTPAMKAWMAATPEEKQKMANDLKNYL